MHQATPNGWLRELCIFITQFHCSSSYQCQTYEWCLLTKGSKYSLNLWKNPTDHKDYKLTRSPATQQSYIYWLTTPKTPFSLYLPWLCRHHVLFKENNNLQFRNDVATTIKLQMYYRIYLKNLHCCPVFATFPSTLYLLCWIPNCLVDTVQSCYNSPFSSLCQCTAHHCGPFQPVASSPGSGSLDPWWCRSSTPWPFCEWASTASRDRWWEYSRIMGEEHIILPYFRVAAGARAAKKNPHVIAKKINKKYTQLLLLQRWKQRQRLLH